MKRNWKAALFRAVVVISVITAIIYEVVKALQNGYPLTDLFSSDNGLIFVLKFVIIPVCCASALWGAVNWIRRGLTAPKRNWDEGLLRVITLIFVIGLIIIAISVFIWLRGQNVDIGESIFYSLIAAAVVVVIGGVVFLVIDWLDRGFNE